ncbi:putative ribosomal protein S21e [Helianthus annuus]|uniref:Ribosomal protein S21e n=2 Tax=Helianthus annuus TaxID=4232 RepID=A0A251TAR7_HELAN|nr:putative ribosomal protein S21e [Helianthus annuus]KAJ0501561.1 putative ribosomal protein S21e [Helianthus annuus]KAJ0509377.1 putative ribosomal protein S21e [Helianthus annuus]KAJ0517468.1 putative ribosomal protein S21e [Helianthus annuus]KAJ0685478.1 putative ribosomal protein S21e [Helianthus annuus]
MIVLYLIKRFRVLHSSNTQQLLELSYRRFTSELGFCCFKKSPTMQNEEGQNMDLYIPRKCSATNRLITSKDHASVQINVGHLDESGLYTGQFSTFALCGFVRAQGDADSALDRLWQRKKVETRQ